MRKLLALAFICLSFTTIGNYSVSPKGNAVKLVESDHAAWSQVYDNLHLETIGLNREVFEYALRGMQKIGPARHVLSIADLSKPSSQKRLYVIDLENNKLLFHTYVAHGRNSGELNAMQFSNTSSSFQSSLGFYKTMNTYQGKHGLSLKLQGLEKGINDNAYSRAIVIHGADYVCEDFIRRTGRLGRSQGCPAVPNEVTKPIIAAIKGGTCLFVYSPSQAYLQQSSFLI
ncbi:murein L,D-transpeptidase catalytic domain family protein [Tellurirhabdus bombi]|uniref:murein L,D-transpeptidase catalytic domain family protein n=1 Tax=Tellurirhabdus bombi TaxID=2907205 RepID=UPI001F2FCFF5|nr:murein L,D-transpeptidase catalytic domain family protein [Tellurirhabdus bombi]